MQKKKFTTYLLYAIGEIVLVVIGILIALSISNLSEEAKDRAKEQRILRQLRDEYKSNLAQLDQKIFMREQGLEAIYTILDFIDHPETLDEEKFFQGMWQIMVDPTFDPIQNDIIGSENLRLIKNDSLVRLLSNWSTEVYQVQELEILYAKGRTELLMPISNRLGLGRNIISTVWGQGYSPVEAIGGQKIETLDISPTKKKIDFYTVLQDVELESGLALAASTHKNTNIQSQTLRKRIVLMLELIEGEIEEE